MVQYWLMKSEPDVYSWDNLVADKKTSWNGVRNYLAANNMRAMKNGDLAFFYHSNIGKEIIGIGEICKEAYPDPSDEKGKFVMVDIKPVTKFKTPVTLATIKATPSLKDMDLLRLSRLSVCSVKPNEWETLKQMGGL